MILKYYSTKHRKYIRIPILFVLGVIIIINISFYFLGSHQKSKTYVNLSYNPVYLTDTTELYLEFSDSNLYEFLKKINVKYPEIVYAQAYLESGRFSSNLFKTNNNLFGMKVPRKRIYLSECDTCSYSKFEDTKLAAWQMSVLDYALWQSKYGNYQTEEEYLNYLGSVYAEDKSYVKRLKILKQQLWQ